MGRPVARYMFGEKGRETVTPGAGGMGHRGPLVAINGDMVVQDATDLELVAQRLSFAVTAAGLGS